MPKLLVIAAFIISTLNAQTIPSSTRAQSAIAKTTPQLKIETSQLGLELGDSIYIRIFKQEAELEIWLKKDNRFHLFKTYPVCTFGFGGLGPKLKEGDGKAPEGFYYVMANQLNPYSSYHLSFNIGFPNAYDRAHNRTGSALMVHGDCVSVGCYAMTDKNIEEIYTLAVAALSNEQKFFRVHIFPFKMTDENMQKNNKSKWIGFWRNLKQGHDFFEDNHFNPPNVTVENLTYHFAAE
ncbi:MAG: murein L,D-transpeptidase [Proteobacteria bacterium]|nr:murein L,D-transpeptidase [Pseudomonadota bacterium]